MPRGMRNGPPLGILGGGPFRLPWNQLFLRFQSVTVLVKRGFYGPVLSLTFLVADPSWKEGNFHPAYLV